MGKRASSGFGDRRARGLVPVVAAICSLVGTAAPALGAGAAGSALVAGYGTWTLARLGYGDLSVPGPRGGALRSSRSVTFRLPRGAHQGGRTWYIGRVFLTVHLAPTSGSGLAYASALSGRDAFAQIKLQIRRRRNRLITTWSTVGLITGPVRRTTAGRQIRISFANYLTYDSIRAGPRRIDFQVEQFGAARVASVDVGRRSGLRVTRTGPGAVAITARLRAAPARVNVPAVLDITLRNPGDLAVTNLTGHVEAAGAAVAGNGSFSVRRLPAGRSVVQSVRLVPRKAGRLQVFVQVSSSANRAIHQLELEVRRAHGTPRTKPDEGGGASPVALALAAIGALLIAAAGFAVRRMRRGGASPTGRS